MGGLMNGNLHTSMTNLPPNSHFLLTVKTGHTTLVTLMLSLETKELVGTWYLKLRPLLSAILMKHSMVIPTKLLDTLLSSIESQRIWERWQNFRYFIWSIRAQNVNWNL